MAADDGAADKWLDAHIGRDAAALRAAADTLAAEQTALEAAVRRRALMKGGSG